MSTKEVTLELRRFATFTGGFFTALSLLVGSVPHLLESYDILPYIPEPEKTASWLASVVAIMVAGSGFLRAQVSREVVLERSTGTEWLFAAVALAVFYLNIALVPETGTGVYLPVFHGFTMMTLYLATFGCLARGFFDMALFAYALPNVQPLSPFRGLIAIRERLAAWSLARREEAWEARRAKEEKAAEEFQRNKELLERRIKAAKETRAAQASKQRTVVVVFLVLTLLLSFVFAFPQLFGL
ncbi:MAG: hypothetical protein AAGF23_09970 [Acidobacteriota bacterium]